MLKKTKIQRASARIASDTAESVQTTCPTFLGYIWGGIKWLFRLIFIRIPRAIWNWLRRLDIAALTNIALMLLIIILFSILICQVLNLRGKGSSAPKTTSTDTVVVAPTPTPVIVPVKTDAPKPTKVTVDVPAKVTFDKDSDELIIKLPLKKTVTPAVESGIIYTPASAKATADKPAPAKVKKPLVADVQPVGDTVIDFARAPSKIASGTTVRGSLFLQNARFYTLPCGVVIEGDLYLRNMGLVRFCGEFTVRGNIYVSSNSTFGPIPGNARLGGQVIF